MIVSIIACAACGDSATDGQGGGGGSGDVTVLTPDAPPLAGQTECVVTITTNLPIEGQKHVDVCDTVDYATNPPSSGNHWGIWAQYRTFDSAVPREMLVHNLEHGAIVMAHDCEGDCTDVIAAFEQAAEDFGPDATCIAGQNGAERSRIVITPQSEIDAPIALSAWGATYVATCIDPPSIQAFIEDHYGNGPEDVCAEGKDPSDPATGVPDCD